MFKNEQGSLLNQNNDITSIQLALKKLSIFKDMDISNIP